MKQGKRITAAAIALLGSITLIATWLIATNRPVNESIPAAIVNLDTPVTIDGQMAPMGRQFAAELVRNPGPFAWQVTSKTEAAFGLREGLYDAVVTIPNTFSTAVTSIQNPSEAVVGTVDLQTRPGSTIGEEALSEIVVDAAASAIGKQLTQNFVGQTLSGFGDLQEGLGDAADGAKQLAGGTKQAAEGLDQLAKGVGQFGDGVTQAADGANQSANGAAQLATGSQTAAQGIDQLANGAQGLSGGTQALADGLGQLAAGTQLMADETAGMGGNIDELVNGLQQYTDGVALLGYELQLVYNQLESFGADFGSFAEEIEPLVMQGIEEGKVQLTQQLEDYVQKACESGEGTPECESAKQLKNQVLQMLDTLFDTLLGYLQNELPAAIEKLEPIIQEQLQPLIEPAITAYVIANGCPGSEILGQPCPPPGQQTPPEGGLVGAGKELMDSLKGEGGIEELKQLPLGIAELNKGAQQSAAGARELAQGQKLYAAGAQESAAGINELAGGMAALADGSTQLADGLNQAAAGATPLTQGANEAAGGMKQLETGASGLAKGLKQAVEEIPTFSQADIDKMSDVLSGPVQVQSAQSGKSMGGPTATALILWLVTLFLALVYRPFSPHVVSSTKPASLLVFEAWWRPALWAGTIGAISGLVLGLWASVNVGTTVALIGVGFIVGIAFISIQQGLNAAFGIFGRLASILILIASAIPKTTITWLPPGGGAKVFESLTIRGIAFTGGALATVIVWGIVAYGLTIWATSSKRKHSDATPAIAGVN